MFPFYLAIFFGCDRATPGAKKTSEKSSIAIMNVSLDTVKTGFGKVEELKSEHSCEKCESSAV